MAIKRKNYFIKKRFQAHFVMRFIILLLIEILLMAGLFMYISNNTMTTGYYGSRLTIEKTSSFFLVPFIFIMLIAGIAVGISAVVVFILFSHRIAGPLFRFEKDLKDISAGDLTKRINLRKTDQLVELKETMNLLAVSLDNHIGRIRSRTLDLEKTLMEKGESSDPGKARKAVELLKDEVDFFKVTSGPKE